MQSYKFYIIVLSALLFFATLQAKAITTIQSIDQTTNTKDLAIKDKSGGQLIAFIGQKKYIFPMLKADIKTDIQGDLATVSISQTFINPMKKAINASYLFPLNEYSAVYEMIMEVGDEKIIAKIQEKEQALKTFQQARREGKSAALLQQHRANMFTQDIANLMPDLPIKVTLRYVQTVPKIDGNYELVLPLVVGPRFQPSKQEKIVTDEQRIDFEQSSNNQPNTQTMNQWKIESLPVYPPVFGLHIPDVIDKNRVSISIDLTAGTPLQSAFSDTHHLAIDKTKKQSWQIKLQNGKAIDNKDFVFKYRLSGDLTQAGLLAYKDERGGFFSLMIEPPGQPAETMITPREMVFVLDCSGSMAGEPMDASKLFMRKALANLRTTDSFRIIRFSDSATEFSQTPIPASPDNIKKGINYINALYGSGGTYMSSGIEQALNPAVPQGSIRIVTFLTDGYIGNEQSILRLIDQKMNNARLFAFGVGSAVNRYLLEEMAHVGRGFVRYLKPGHDTESITDDLVTRLQSPVLTDIEIDWGKLSVTQISPQKIPDLFAGQTIRVQGRYQQAGQYLIKVKGVVNGHSATLPIMINLPENSAVQGEAIALIWARSQIKQQMRKLVTSRDHSMTHNVQNKVKEQVIQLGLDFSLITQWTSFVASSEKIYNAHPEDTPTRSVPLPQVAHVSSTAYTHSPTTFTGHGTPEPGVLLSLMVILLFFTIGLLTKKGKRAETQ